MRALALAVAVLAAPSPLRAQDARGSLAERLAAAVALPAAARELRASGVPSGEVAVALEALGARTVPADEARGVLLTAAEAASTKGPIDNFGAFVRSQVQAGVRGRDLSAAIRNEPPRRGRAVGQRGDTATDKRGGRSGGDKRKIP